MPEKVYIFAHGSEYSIDEISTSEIEVFSSLKDVKEIHIDACNTGSPTGSPNGPIAQQISKMLPKVRVIAPVGYYGPIGPHDTISRQYTSGPYSKYGIGGVPGYYSFYENGRFIGAGKFQW